MAPSFDRAVSSLLCVEDSTSVFGDYDGDGAVEEDFEATWDHRSHRGHHQDRCFEGRDELLPMQSEECFAVLLEKERQHLPGFDYLHRLRNGDLDLGARAEAVDWMGKVHAHFSFGPLSAYLSVNYLDRFLSAYELPKGKAWMTQLLAVACLSLAAKMEETEVPLSLDLQVGESKFVFEARTIQRMELLVLSTLGWRMQAVTPFSYLDHFLRKINGGNVPLRTLISRSVQLILSITKGVDFVEFRPSEVAAAVAITVARENQLMDIEEATSVLTQHVRKERVLKCIELISDMALSVGLPKSGTSVSSVPQSPIGVLDAACLSYKSDETALRLGANSSHNSPDPKRRRT
ncbi:cyclin-D4-1-like [Rhodamnia argentea]|uniref:Cyclin-D4-1-like n=1 Tax=Rhodamnia argentea TaxID=178133 RepID=A0A8B8P2A8_9MYRT|nr:cyclin-D4-1-like [Rhodamnia argentea]